MNRKTYFRPDNGLSNISRTYPDQCHKKNKDNYECANENEKSGNEYFNKDVKKSMHEDMHKNKNIVYHVRMYLILLI